MDDLKAEAADRDVQGKRTSENFLDFIAPYNDPTYSETEYRKLVSIAILAWNTATFQGDEREQELKRLSAKIAEIAGDDWGKKFSGFIGDMIERKDRYFSNDKRLICEYSLTYENNLRYLNLTIATGTNDAPLSND